MEFNVTSIKCRRRNAGSSLIELIVMTGISGVVMLVLASLTLHAGRSFASIANYSDLDRHSRVALDRMSQEIRQAQSVKSYSATELVLLADDGSDLTFLYDKGSKQLLRVKGEVKEVLLPGCDSMTFELFQRNPLGGGEQYDVFHAAKTAATVKLVQMTWVCSRTLFGRPHNTEVVQSSKIVIRKQQGT